MKSIGVLGVGQAGGNIAEIAATMGFPTALINTNPRDGKVNTRVENKFFVPGYNGAGQDRLIGIRAVKDHYYELIDFVKRSFKHTHFLLVAFSTDGGTGSGMSPLLIDLLTDHLPGMNVGALAVIPERNVLAGNRINAAECIEELSNIQSISSVFLVDNDQVRKMNPQASKQQIYHSSNHQAIHALYHVSQMTQKSSLYGNFDETDLMTILNTRGVSLITMAPVTDAKTSTELSSKIHHSWGNSIFCPVESTGVIRASLIYDGPENMAKLIHVPSIFQKVGEPLQLFEGTYLSETDPTITTILAGLPFPSRRMLALEETIEKNKERLEKLVNKEHTQKYKSKITWASELKAKRSDKKAESVNTKLSKYQK
ncbi:cell division protein FtsZ [Bacillus sp. B15-48]|uniref:cell division protein FtsZ n=1 Tax=Bacillus sp. B15-48 TaxID=1548601 RepID=UPI00193F6E4F|nr:cell division protein FtsZ [Bacillus sp. B15-48]MBM4763519.1 cell division protein FtsZ [Bacillus sp. B15-48]